MSTLTTTPAPAGAAAPARESALGPARPIGFGRLVGVESFKMFNTRSGFWLIASIGILAALATGAVLAFGGESSMTFETFSSAVGVPMAVILPVVAILSITSEWSQRTGLTSFTLVPHRGRVIAAKLVVALAIGLVGILLATGIGALGNLAGAALHGIDPVWGFSLADQALVVLASTLGMLMGFTFGALFRSSPVAIVAYFVYSLVLPNLFGALAFYQDWFSDLWPWVDFFYSTTNLYDGTQSGREWAQLATSGLIWMVIPLAFGLWRTSRSEVK